ncbi:restriction endonuclease subunit S [Comamonas jiangduensis]|uniref:restriction endonuclease subunit S n=1 Tax=Comamonas jiangduensis TaxID=1194168 RepID=UPI003BF900D4
MELLATAPGGVARLRELILTLAVQGKLVPQDPADEPASVLLRKIRAEKDRLLAEGKIKKDKPLTVIAEEEKPFELPMGWEWVRFGEVLDFQGGGQPPKSNFSEVPLPDYVQLIQIRDLGDKPQPVYIPRKLASKFCTTSDVMVGRYGASVGKVFWGKEGAYNVALVKMVDEHQVFDRRFLFQLLLSPIGQSLFAGISRSAQDGFNKNDIEAKLIPLAPLAEQSRIVARVEELMCLCDALEAKGQLEATQHAQLLSTLLGTLTASATPEELADNWQRVAQHFDLLLDRPEAIDALEQTLLQLAVRGLLVPQDPTDEPASVLLQKIRAEKDRLIAAGQIKRDKPLPPITDEEKPFELPVGWEWVRVGDVVELLNGYAFKSEWFKSAGVRLLRNMNISHGHVDWSASVMLDAVAAQSYEQFALSVGDIVLSLDRPIISTGLKYAVIRESDLPCLLLQRVARLTVFAFLSPEFLQLWLQSDLFVGTIDPGRSNGVPHISTKQVAGLAFALPPLAEQSRIVARVTQLRRLCADLRQRLAEREAVQARLAEALVASVA